MKNLTLLNNILLVLKNSSLDNCEKEIEQLRDRIKKLEGK